MRPVPERSRSLHALRERMVAGGYREVINFSFVDEASERDLGSPERSIRVLNPIAAQHALMRTSLMGGLVANLRYNLNRGATRVRVFEIGRAFLRDPAVGEGPLAVAGIDQPMRVAALAWGPVDEEIWANPKRGVDFFDAKGDLEALCDPLPLRLTPAQHPALHPGRCARVELEGRPIGWIGELHPRWVQAQELASPPVLFELDAEPLLARPFPRFAEVSRFPVMVRDLALVFDEAVPYQAVLDAVRAWQPPAVTSLSVFDLYRGKGIPETRKSLAFRVVMQDTGRTLTDAEADALGQEMVALLREKFGAELR
jgi:phenylalanyl-tRNA synthetase beta chain